MEYQVVIPSYGRHEIIGERTLQTLQDLKFHDRDRITIAVPDWKQEADYREVLGNEYRIAVTAPGKVHSQRAYHKLFPEGTRLVNLDDDIQGIRVLDWSTEKIRTLPYTGDLDYIVRMGFGVTESLGGTLWGMVGNNMALHMNHKVSLGMKLIGGWFQGNYAGDEAICGDDRTYLESSEEDGETSCRTFLRCGVLPRFSWLTTVSKKWNKLPGGIRSELKASGFERRESTNNAAFEGILERYPGIGRVIQDDEGDSKIRYNDPLKLSVPRTVIEEQFGKPEVGQFESERD